MNINESIGSLIMTGFRGASLDDPQCRADVQLLKDLRIKGVILFDTHLPAQSLRNIINENQLKKLTDDLKHELGDDLIIAIDQEGGGVNRLGVFEDAAISQQLSAQMQGIMSETQLTATIDPVAKVLSEMGVNLTFAPCVDLNINPNNPIIAGKDRSLGTDPKRVAKAASTIVSAHHKHSVRCCIKHFPGHGSSTTDTHDGLADITETYSDDEQQVYQLLNDSMTVGTTPPCAAMTGHLINRNIDANLPASLSHAHTTGLLREHIGFNGLVITDSIDMGAIRLHHDCASASVHAIQAGADMVLDGFNSASTPPTDHPAPIMHKAILAALDEGQIDESSLADSMGRRQSLFF